MQETPVYPPRILYEGYRDAAGTLLAVQFSHEAAAGMGADLHLDFAAPCIVADQTTSSFDLAWALDAEQSLPPWASVVCWSQTGGRGQMRRHWHSPPGNLYVSFFLPEQTAELNDLAPLYVSWLIHQALAAMGILTALKWPNDILLRLPGGDEGKFGGLLLEERGGRLLAGLGLNVRSAPPTDVLRIGRAVPAAALPHYTGTPCKFWRELVRHIRAGYAAGPTPGEPDAVRRKITAALAWQGRRIQADEPECTGVLDGLEIDGALRLLTPQGYAVIRSGSIRLAE